MGKKVCFKCQQEKDVEDFYVKSKSKGTYHSYCKTCCSERHQQYYSDNKPTYMKNKRKRVADLRETLNSLKDSPCQDCKQKFPPYVMEWDHLDGSQKVDAVSVILKWGSLSKLLEEIAKCELVCANCHRVRTHIRAQALKV